MRWTILAALFATSALAEDARLSIAHIRAAISAGEYDAAIRQLDTAMHVPATDHERAEMHFYLGLVHQSRIDEITDPGRRRDELLAAVKAYETALEGLPGSAGTAHNLARAYAALGDQRAEEYFLRAIRFGGDDAAAYSITYAQYLRAAGREAEAVKAEKSAADKRPKDPDAQKELIELLHAQAQTGLPDYIRQLVDAGFVDRARDAVLDALARPVRDEKMMTTLLALLARSLATDAYEPPKLAESADGLTLRRIASSVTGAGELLALHQRKSFEPAEYPWWSAAMQRDEEARRSFSLLLQRIAEWYTRQEDRDTAARYYDLRLMLAPEFPDPIAVIGLIEIYSDRGEYDKVRELAHRYDPNAGGKRAELADFEAQEREFDFHQTVGVALSEAPEQTRRAYEPSISYHLETARQFAHSYNEYARNQKDTLRLRIEPEVIELLAAAAEQRNGRRRAVGLRVAAAADYLTDGETSAATEILADVREELRSDETYRLAGVVREFLNMGDGDATPSQLWADNSRTTTVSGTTGSSVTDNTASMPSSSTTTTGTTTWTTAHAHTSMTPESLTSAAPFDDDDDDTDTPMRTRMRKD